MTANELLHQPGAGQWNWNRAIEERSCVYNKTDSVTVDGPALHQKEVSGCFINGTHATD